ncbi:hypothetical protein M1146_03335 [Patescibacteria group bacterium]|nr:hypothetical protein [Patescibacteria group bacterium]
MDDNNNNITNSNNETLITSIYETLVNPVTGITVSKKSWLGFTFERAFVGTFTSPHPIALHSSPFIALHSSFFTLHPSSFILHPSSFILRPSSLYPFPLVVPSPNIYFANISYHFLTRRQGKELVKWLIMNLYAATKGEAKKIGSQLLKAVSGLRVKGEG